MFQALVEVAFSPFKRSPVVVRATTALQIELTTLGISIAAENTMAERVA